MRAFAPCTSLIDVCFQGHPEYIACYVLETSGGLVLVDPGPSSTRDALEEGLRLAGLSLDNVTDVLLTHIHLDHAGATGSIVSDHPRIRVHVHVNGARHMVSPERLLASATRLYGDAMDRLWGEVLAVPKDSINALEGGETLDLDGRALLVEYTPGHAAHHVSYFDPATGTAWVGDTLGIRIDNRAYVMPVTPPPDIDLAQWAASHAKIRAWDPTTLCPTHFGPARPVAEHIAEHEERLEEWSAQVRRDVGTGSDPARAAADFCRRVLAEVGRKLGSEDVPAYAAGGGIDVSWHGLARYYRKLAEEPDGAS